MRNWIRISFGPVFGIAATQVTWTIILIIWIIAFAERRSQLIWGLVLLGMLLLGVTSLVIHLARQISQTRAVKDFVSQVSHDLRSPLATAKLHLETVMSRALDEKQKENCLSAALQELQRLETNIESVLTASRLERKKLALSTEPMRLDDFLRDYAASKKDNVTLRGGTLSASYLPPLTVEADYVLMTRMLDNLVDNAMVHCHKGVNIELALAEQTRCAVIDVIDDGPGLPSHEWRKIFRMFYRSARSNYRKGTGLGLFIVWGIARAHGGRAWVENSTKGKGCRFRVAIPLLEKSEIRT
jgi:signal transduction histidine kinase